MNATINNFIVLVAFNSVTGFVKKLEAAQRRGAKLGVELRFEEGEARDEFVAKESLPLEVQRRCRDPRGLWRRVVPFTITGPELRLEGWTMVGAVDHTEAGNILRSMSGEQIPEEYREAPNYCDHCKTHRRRKMTVVVRNELTGEYRRVGTTCIDAYLGGNWQAEFGKFDFLNKLWQRYSEFGCGGDECFGGGGYLGTPTVSYLAWVALSIRLSGWTSKGKAWETGQTATATDAWALWTNAGREGAPCPSDEDFECAKASLEWGANVQTLGSDYLQNLKVVCSLPALNPKHEGIAASVIMAYRREQEKQLAEERRARAAESSDWIGKVKVRFGGKAKGAPAALTGTIDMVRSFEVDGYSPYQPTVIKDMVKMTTDDGNVLIWWYSGSKSLVPGVRYSNLTGTRVSIVGTVKCHNTYQGVKQTELTRCALTKLDN
jgi:hypothetical protein